MYTNFAVIIEDKETTLHLLSAPSVRYERNHYEYITQDRSTVHSFKYSLSAYIGRTIKTNGHIYKIIDQY